MVKYNLTQVANREDTPSLSTIRRDINTGKISVEKNSKGRILFDISELVRVYGIDAEEISKEPFKRYAKERLEMPLKTSNDNNNTSNNTKIISILEGQIEVLQEEKKELMQLVKTHVLQVTDETANTEKYSWYAWPVLFLGLAAWTFVIYRIVLILA